MTRPGYLEKNKSARVDSQSAWMDESGAPLRHACSRRSQQVADAGALAPVVFSGDDEPQTCKIRKIKAQEGPIPPNSTLLSSMALLVSSENAYISCFDRTSSTSTNYGI